MGVADTAQALIKIAHSSDSGYQAPPYFVMVNQYAQAKRSNNGGGMTALVI